MRILAMAVLLVARTAAAGACVAGAASTDRAQIGSDAAVVCYERLCWRLDYATRAWTVVGEPAVVEPAAPKPKVTLATKVRVCSLECHDLTLPGVAAISAEDVVESADRSLIATRGPEDEHDQPVYVLEAATGALRATIHPWNAGMGDHSSFQLVEFVGGTLLVAVSSGPVTNALRLYAPRTGKLLGQLGDKHEEIDPTDVGTELGGHRWAFRALERDELYVLDVATGARLPSIRSGPKDGGYRALVRAGGLLVGVRGAAQQGVMLYDLDKHKATHATVPLCK